MQRNRPLGRTQLGIETADMLVHEVLSRNMRDRRALALAPWVFLIPGAIKRSNRRLCAWSTSALPKVAVRTANLSGADQ